MLMASMSSNEYPCGIAVAIPWDRIWGSGMMRRMSECSLASGVTAPRSSQKASTISDTSSSEHVLRSGSLRISAFGATFVKARS